MNDEDIQQILDRLGNRVSRLGEENRLCKLRDDAGKELIQQLGQYLSSEDWINVFESSEDTNLLVVWGKWNSQANHDSYLEMRKSTGLFDQVMDMLSEPFEVLHLDSVSV